MVTNKDFKIESEKKEIIKEFYSLDFVYYIARRSLVIILVVLLGFLVVNQFLDFRFKAQFLGGPCKLCADLNPDVDKCIKELNNPRASYWTSEGWTDPLNENKTYYINLSLMPQ
jgi:hypothetical protein